MNRLRGKYRFLPPDIAPAPHKGAFRIGPDTGRPYPRTMARITKRRAGRRGWHEFNRLVRTARRYGFIR